MTYGVMIMEMEVHSNNELCYTAGNWFSGLLVIIQYGCQLWDQRFSVPFSSDWYGDNCGLLALGTYRVLWPMRIKALIQNENFCSGGIQTDIQQGSSYVLIKRWNLAGIFGSTRTLHKNFQLLDVRHNLVNMSILSITCTPFTKVLYTRLSILLYPLLPCHFYLVFIFLF